MPTRLHLIEPWTVQPQPAWNCTNRGSFSACIHYSFQEKCLINSIAMTERKLEKLVNWRPSFAMIATLQNYRL
jgi:hypothetical protein